VFKDALYFTADDGNTGNGRELWKYEINELYFSAPDSPTGFELWGNADGSDGFELWKKKTISEPENSVWGMVAALWSDVDGSGGSNPGSLTVFNNELYFSATDPTLTHYPAHL